MRIPFAALVPTAVACAALSSASGCGRGPGRLTDTAAGVVGEKALPTPLAGSADTTVLTTPRGPVVLRGDSVPGTVAVPAERVHWTPEVVIERLTSLGLAAREVGDAPRSPFDASGVRVEVAGGRAEVRAYVLGDASAVARALLGVDTAAVERRGAPIAWPMPASLVRDNNLVAVVLTRDAALRQRIRYALATHQR